MEHIQKLLKNGMIMVIIHEVGHNFFPMIVNSDERQWTWMDERHQYLLSILNLSKRLIIIIHLQVGRHIKLLRLYETPQRPTGAHYD